MIQKIVLCTLLPALLVACSEPTPEKSQMPGLTTAPYQPDSGTMLVRCGSLIDGRSDEVLSDVSVLIEDGRFSKIASRPDVPAGTEILDLSEYTCLPGLIEMHAHMLESFEELVDLTMYYDYSHEDYMQAGRKVFAIVHRCGFYQCTQSRQLLRLGGSRSAR